MVEAGLRLAEVFEHMRQFVVAGVTTLSLDEEIGNALCVRKLVSGSRGYKGFKHFSCISMNDEVVHGIPSRNRIVKNGDLVKIDISASYRGYFADMARPFVVGLVPSSTLAFIKKVEESLDRAIERIIPGQRLSRVSEAVQICIEDAGYSVIRDFAGHGIGRSMHEEPEILNYVTPKKGPVLRSGMALAVEPMVAMRDYNVYITPDGWTVKTLDGSLAMHVEDTIIVTETGPLVITRLGSKKFA